MGCTNSSTLISSSTYKLSTKQPNYQQQSNHQGTPRAIKHLYPPSYQPTNPNTLKWFTHSLSTKKLTSPESPLRAPHHKLPRLHTSNSGNLHLPPPTFLEAFHLVLPDYQSPARLVSRMTRNWYRRGRRSRTGGGGESLEDCSRAMGWGLSCIVHQIDLVVFWLSL